MFLDFPDKSTWHLYADKIGEMVKSQLHEKEFRKYFTENPWILSHCFNRGEGVVFSEYHIKEGENADHLLICGRSMNMDVNIIELKSPVSRILKANGRSESPALNEALTKLRNKASYLNDNQAVFQERFTTSITKLLNEEPCSFQGAVDRDFRSKARLPIEKFVVFKYVIIGDRDNETTDEKAYRQTLYRGLECIDVMPYQRVSDLLRR